MDTNEHRYWSVAKAIALAAVSTSLLLGCARQPSVILDDTVCRPPCWQGITPGKTTAEEAIDRLSSMPEVKTVSDSPKMVDSRRGYVSWIFSRSVRESSGRIYLEGGLVEAIQFDVERSLGLGEMIDKLGEPDQVSAISAWADTRWLVIVLLYPRMGQAVVHYNGEIPPEARFAEIEPGLPVFEVHYFNPNVYDSLLRADHFTGVAASETVILNSIQPWRGFGHIQLTELRR